jgi:hypothetical protein
MEQRKKEPKIKAVRREKNLVAKGVDTKRFCGVLKLQEEPLLTQKRLRNEWD